VIGVASASPGLDIVLPYVSRRGVVS